MSQQERQVVVFLVKRKRSNKINGFTYDHSSPAAFTDENKGMLQLGRSAPSAPPPLHSNFNAASKDIVGHLLSRNTAKVCRTIMKAIAKR